MPRNNSILAKRKKSNGDNYRTPYFITRAALQHCCNWRGIWTDPCPGRHDDITKTLAQKGILHRKTTGDMFKQEFKSEIITNPPYSLIDKFMDYFFNHQKFVTRIILLLPVEYETVKKRKHFFDKYLVKKILFTTRMNLTTWRKGEVADFGAVSYAWYEFHKETETHKLHIGIRHDNSENQYRKPRKPRKKKKMKPKKPRKEKK